LARWEEKGEVCVLVLLVCFQYNNILVRVKGGAGDGNGCFFVLGVGQGSDERRGYDISGRWVEGKGELACVFIAAFAKIPDVLL
jgi:hypothetical protein